MRPMPRSQRPATMAAMQLVLTPPPPQAAAPGQLVADLPGAPAGTTLQLHTLATGAQALWPASSQGALLVLTDGLGKATVDGAALRVTAPCVLRQPAGAELRLANQGSATLRVLVIRPVIHDEPAG